MPHQERGWDGSSSCEICPMQLRRGRAAPEPVGCDFESFPIIIM